MRTEPNGIEIGVESSSTVSESHRAIYMRAVAAAGVNPTTVLVVRVTEARVEVDAMDPDQANWPVRTWRVPLTGVLPQ